MTRTCARPGCREHAVATLTYAYRDRSVHLAALAAEGHPMAHDLCETHSVALTVPRGWSLRDQRRAAPVPDEADGWTAPLRHGAIPA